MNEPDEANCVSFLGTLEIEIIVFFLGRSLANAPNHVAVFSPLEVDVGDQ